MFRPYMDIVPAWVVAGVKTHNSHERHNGMVVGAKHFSPDTPSVYGVGGGREGERCFAPTWIPFRLGLWLGCVDGMVMGGKARVWGNGEASRTSREGLQRKARRERSD
jgi:hypothetical protein